MRSAVAGWVAAGAGEPLHLKYRLVSKDGRVCWCRESLFAASGEALAGAIVDVTELKVLQNTLEAVAGASQPREAVLAVCDALAQALALHEVGWVSPGRGERLVCSYGALGVRESARWQPPGELPPLVARSLEGGLTALTEGGNLAAPVPGLGGALFGRSLAKAAPTQHHLRVAEALAQQLELALQRADLVVQLEETARDRQRLAEALQRAHEEERSRLARELHDGAGQTLTAVAIQLDLAERGLSESARLPLSRARRQVEETLEELRRLSHALRPAALDRLGLREALAEMCRDLRGQQLNVTLRFPEAPLELAEERATALFRIAQAALTNVVRHASAKTAAVHVELDAAARTVALTVEDDGRGFDPQTAPRSLGLWAMRERALALGGELSLRTSAGAGCSVRAVLPLQ